MNHVAMVIPGLDRLGGAERQLLLLAHGLSRRRWKVSVVALSGSGGGARQLSLDAGADFYCLEMRKGLVDPRGWLRFHHWMRESAPQIVHAHLPHAVWMARWSRLAAPVRVVLDTLHSSSTGGRARRLGYRWSDWLTDQSTAVSQAAADAHRCAGMTTKLQVLPNGIDTGIFHPDATVRAQLRSELQLGEEFLWIAAGRMEAVKDYPTMLRAMAQLPDRARLVVAGSGPMEGEIKVLCEQLGLNARVHFVGFDPEVQRWMQAADGFVLASRWEGLPLGLLEAAACGLPGVATDVPGSREAVIAGETGLLATANNVQALAQAMNQLMQMAPAERKAMGDKAREMVLERFGIEAVLDRWESLYEQLLACNTSPKRVSGRAIVRR